MLKDSLSALCYNRLSHGDVCQCKSIQSIQYNKCTEKCCNAVRFTFNHFKHQHDQVTLGHIIRERFALKL